MNAALARCDAEIARNAELHDCPAYLVALDVRGWELERALIAGETPPAIAHMQPRPADPASTNR